MILMRIGAMPKDASALVKHLHCLMGPAQRLRIMDIAYINMYKVRYDHLMKYFIWIYRLEYKMNRFEYCFVIIYYSSNKFT